MPPPSQPPQSDGKADLGAGLTLKSPKIENHPSGPPQHGEFGQAERGVSIASTFLSGILAINAAQFIGLPFKMIDPKFYNDYIAFTKQSFAVLVTTITQWWSPTKVHVSGDSSIPGQLFQKPDGSLECRFPERAVLMANHQLYTDWLYLWWIAYTNKMAGHVYIILKESIKNIPLIGWGTQFYNFIFLARNWEKDKPRFQQHLQELSNPKDPMWLIIFPEGTNLSRTTRESSRRWAEKNGIKDMRHQLLPRSTGLRFCLENLKGSVDWLYDCTIAYEGVPQGQYGQDIYTLQSSFFEGRPPKSVNMHWRRFRISQIPIHDDKAFEVWLRNRWKEKDHYLDYFARTGAFPSKDPWKAGSVAEINRIKPAKNIEAQVKSGSWGEFLAIFAPITAFLTAQQKGQLDADGALPPALAKKALKNARAAGPAASDASGTTAGQPQYGEWDAIRKALAQKNMGQGVGSFAPKAPTTVDSVSGHRSFSQPAKTRVAGNTSTTTPSSAAAARARAPLKVDSSNDALNALLAKNLGKAKDSKQLAQQTIRLANGQTIKASAPETAGVKKEEGGKVRLANGLVVGGGETQAPPKIPVKLANGLTVGGGGQKGQAPSPAPSAAAAARKPPAKLATASATTPRKTPQPLRKTAAAPAPQQPARKPAPALPSTVLPKPQKPTAAGGGGTTASTPSLASGPTRSASTISTPAQSAGKVAAAQQKGKAPVSKTPQQQKTAGAAAQKKPQAQGQKAPANAPKKNAIPLTVQDTSRGPKEKVPQRKIDAIEARKGGDN